MQNHLKPTDPEWNILKLLKWTTSYFKSHDIDSPRATAEILLAHALKKKRIDLYVEYDQPLSDRELSLYKSLIKRRVDKEPVAYIVGEREFWSMDFVVTRDVIIPRPETECLVEAVLSLLPGESGDGPDRKPKRILELGTGSGAVILALACHRPHHFFFASDRSTRAIALAKQNAKRHNLDEKSRFFAGDWFAPIDRTGRRFDIILSNPPYIRTGAIGGLQPEVRRYEPMIALDGDEDGFGCLKRIIEDAPFYLGKKGSLLLEIGHDQKDGIRRMIDDTGSYEDVEIVKDYSGYDRVVRMKKRCCG
ncbi:MAG: peptide chain release factor N(5)-glutamine methyltransferase [Deltaproteobacteria bacterium]|nr:peptide chain release factor N(5)-glutamine methyltransferase [Deltaproteobacteria bacterium]MBW2193263.1 peptide chain release factor N(5)-glutamine methyltransferase [Deltaproteobacteria bacterium]